jgi:prefoldin subunit 5
MDDETAADERARRAIEALSTEPRSIEDRLRDLEQRVADLEQALEQERSYQREQAER